jgi:demethylmenaquinone methyltransferase/2-methoxy-6-polyprenyl-1,4-benzoquinol methylase
MVTTTEQKQILAHEVMYPLIQPVFMSAMDELNLPVGGLGLDAGCGIGLQALLLAQKTGAKGRVTGVDLSFSCLDRAENNASKAGVAHRVNFLAGDVASLPFKEKTFDWAWSSDCIGYAPIAPLPLIMELKRVVKPGGIIALLGWSSEMLLPGYPELEASLKATKSGIAPFRRGANPANHFLRALGWFLEAGLIDRKAKAFVNSLHAPLGNDQYKAMLMLFDMRWRNTDTELSAEKFSGYRNLCMPDSHEFILNLEGYYAFFNYSLFTCRVPEK